MLNKEFILEFSLCHNIIHCLIYFYMASINLNESISNQKPGKINRMEPSKQMFHFEDTALMAIISLIYIRILTCKKKVIELFIRKYA